LKYECFFTKTARNEYKAWQRSSPRTVEKIDELISDIAENGLLAGKGKPEQLKYFKNPLRYSRHIFLADRLVYCSSGKNLLIISARGITTINNGPLQKKQQRANRIY
jgi:toxin YoeB